MTTNNLREYKVSALNDQAEGRQKGGSLTTTRFEESQGRKKQQKARDKLPEIPHVLPSILGPRRSGQPSPQAIEFEVRCDGNSPSADEKDQTEYEDPFPGTDTSVVSRRRCHDGLRDCHDKPKDGDYEEHCVLYKTRDMSRTFKNVVLGAELVGDAYILRCEAGSCG